ncbi:hypothetical protein [Marinicellulosiphila megalodicopiae]|uniref:hypothetical protein n=1 Tax=Marinicellulosiphila megalodicopiae TaxID=2724896 RepID=UPI003BB1E4AB
MTLTKINKGFASLSLFLAFIGLSVTAGFMFLGDYQQKISVLHICFSLQFVMSLILHLLNNLKILFKYWRQLQILGASVLFSCALTIGALLQFTPFNNFYNFEQSSKQDGNKIITNELLRYDLLRYKQNFSQFTFDQGLGFDLNLNLDLDLTEKKFSRYIIAIWLEDNQGELVTPLGYIAHNFLSKQEGLEQLLPHFFTKLEGIKPELVESTVANNPLLIKMSTDTIDNLTLKMELNILFDLNESFPLIGRNNLSEKDGQPSIVYQSTLNNEVQWLEFIGQTDKQGQLTPSKENLTTIHKQFRTLLVEVITNEK